MLTPLQRGPVQESDTRHRPKARPRECQGPSWAPRPPNTAPLWPPSEAPGSARPKSCLPWPLSAGTPAPSPRSAKVAPFSVPLTTSHTLPQPTCARLLCPPVLAGPQAPEDVGGSSPAKSPGSESATYWPRASGICYFISKPVSLHQDKEKRLIRPTLEGYCEDEAVMVKHPLSHSAPEREKIPRAA